MKSRDSTGYYHSAPIATCNYWSPGTSCGRSARVKESTAVNYYDQLIQVATGASHQNIWISLLTVVNNFRNSEFCRKFENNITYIFHDT